MCQGRYLAGCVTSPALCLFNRLPRSSVRPMYVPFRLLFVWEDIAVSKLHRLACRVVVRALIRIANKSPPSSEDGLRRGSLHSRCARTKVADVSKRHWLAES